MRQIIVGMGQQKSVRNVAAVAEKELLRTQGAPRTVIAKGRGVEIRADRPGFEGEYQSWTIRWESARVDKAALEAALARAGGACTRTDDNGWVVVRSGGAGVDPGATVQVLDALVQAVPLPETWRVVGENFRVDRISTELLFQAMIQYKASDTHLCPGETPVFRIDNQMRHSEVLGVLSSAQILALIEEICSDDEWQEFQNHKQVSINFHQMGLGFSRVSAFFKAGAPHITFRFLPEIIPSFEDLNIPRDTMVQLAQMHHGLVLVTGMTGSGKTTTVAALVDWINSNRSLHILAIENPVEYVHRNKKSMVSQRNTGVDVDTFDAAVRGALRHDPDVIVIGEMRDPDTIRSAINAAATGHLVISTLHSNTAAEVINRVVSFFDPVERDLVKLQLRDSVRCVICQRLLPRVGGGRVPALEIMFSDIKPIRDGILAGDTDGIRIGMQQTVSHSFLFEDYLFRLNKKGIVDLDNARAASTDVSILDQMVMGTYSIPRLDTIKSAHMGHV